jgi:outer membrane protein assembly factor BamB
MIISRFHARTAWIAVGLALLSSGVSLGAGQTSPLWSQWRGPTRDGLVPGHSWPDTLKGEHLRRLWRVELGPSYSGPIVAADRVFVTETEDKTYEVVHALDRKNGKELWKTRWKGALAVPFFAKSNGDWIRSTPAYDGENLYVAGMRDVLICLNAKTGAERWRIDFVDRFGTALPAFGFVSSPLVEGGAVYVQAAAAVVKIDKKTGKVLWRSARDAGGMQGSAFSSPLLADIAGKRQLLAQTREKLVGIDPASGEVLWSQPVPAFRGMNILTPVVYKDAVFASSYGGRSCLFQIAREKGRFSVKTSWTNPAEGYMSTPIVIESHAYLHLRNQRLTCLDLATGKQRWLSTRTFGRYWSMIAQGNRLLALDEKGVLYLLRANPERFDLLDSRRISEAETWAHVAIGSEELFVRELNAIAAYRWE